MIRDMIRSIPSVFGEEIIGPFVPGGGGDVHRVFRFRGRGGGSDRETKMNRLRGGGGG